MGKKHIPNMMKISTILSYYIFFSGLFLSQRQSLPLYLWKMQLCCFTADDLIKGDSYDTKVSKQ